METTNLVLVLWKAGKKFFQRKSFFESLSVATR